MFLFAISCSHIRFMFFDFLMDCILLQVSSVQLRDDLLSMLVAGHETTGSVLTWTAYLLSKVQ